MVVVLDLGTYLAFTECVAASRCLHTCNIELVVRFVLSALSISSSGNCGRALESLRLWLDVVER
jgi:hypothetical protein